jgi:oxygen-independent coproporphyrinogen III oxidase
LTTKRKKVMNIDELIRKYDVPVPRYTSYPTVPCWDTDTFEEGKWWSAVERCFSESNVSKGISIYVHLPFCESLCTYCACNTRITRNHSWEEKYLQKVLDEWKIYLSHLDGTPVIREIHLGGGTPTFFSPENLSKLVMGILKGCTVHPHHEFSFEGHPNNTTVAHLRALYDLGFGRVSFGVQDLDPRVQKAINRIQPFENLSSAVLHARGSGYSSVSFDLIYGLPYQTLSTVHDTISKVITLRPDRIAFYSYAHVPWLRPGQRGYEDADLPSDVAKRLLYEAGRRLLLEAGYIDIGMDHFSLPSDSLALAHNDGSLHRNFMGYTTNQTDLLIGLGTSAISDAKYAYAQNEKKVEPYLARVADNEAPLLKGHIQSDEDIVLRKLILDVVCKGAVSWQNIPVELSEEVKLIFSEMEKEGIVELTDTGCSVTEIGRPFIRNIASVFDRRMQLHQKAGGPLFSKAI